MDRRIGLDIDGVLANFLQGFIDRASQLGVEQHFPRNWWEWTTHYHGDQTVFDYVWATVTDDPAFWSKLEPLVRPSKIVFPVAAYVTARPCPADISLAWLVAHGFPEAPVRTVPYGSSKVADLKALGITEFIDDNVGNFEEINRADIKCFLWNTPVNRTYNDRGLRIYDFRDVLRAELVAA